MKRLGVLIVGIGILSLILVSESFGQRGMMRRGSGGWGPHSQYNRLYDPKTVETISGEVTTLDTITPMGGMSYGLHVMVKTEKEEISVHLGPGWFMENQDIEIKPGDKLEVKGSRVTFNGKPAIIAAEVKRGDQLLKLRDETGLPVWSGWRSIHRGIIWRGSGGWEPESQYNRMYDPKTVETIIGEVVSLETITPIRGMSYGLHMMVKTDKEEISIHLGPGWFMENQNIKVEPGDKVEVKGSRVTFDGKPAIIASEVKKGDQFLKLRDETGLPIWSGWRR